MTGSTITVYYGSCDHGLGRALANIYAAAFQLEQRPGGFLAACGDVTRVTIEASGPRASGQRPSDARV